VKTIQEHVEAQKKSSQPKTAAPKVEAESGVPVAPNKISVPALSDEKSKPKDAKKEKKSPKKEDNDDSESED
jgi:hypothetical protein